MLAAALVAELDELASAIAKLAERRRAVSAIMH